MNNSDIFNQSQRKDFMNERQKNFKASKEKSYNKSVFNVSFIRPDRSYLGQDSSEINEIIWGTNVNVYQLKLLLFNFIRNFNPQEKMLLESEHSYYMGKLKQIKETSQFYLVVSASDIHEFDPKLYLYLTHFPAEIILLFDNIITQIYMEEILTSEEREYFDHSIKIRLVDLKSKSSMRGLTHEDLNKLVSLKGIFMWLSQVKPEPREICFKCAGCGHVEFQRVER